LSRRNFSARSQCSNSNTYYCIIKSFPIKHDQSQSLSFISNNKTERCIKVPDDQCVPPKDKFDRAILLLALSLYSHLPFQKLSLSFHLAADYKSTYTLITEYRKVWFDKKKMLLQLQLLVQVLFIFFSYFHFHWDILSSIFKGLEIEFHVLFINFPLFPLPSKYSVLDL
jgi:hypothetical protein